MLSAIRVTLLHVTAILAAAAVVTVARRASGMVCIGDCNRDSDVTVNEIITMVDIGLETADPSTCVAGDANGSGDITVNEIVAGVSNALSGCAPPVGRGACGDQVVDADTGEECDDGGVCVGGTNAGVACAADTDCQGEGVCDAFGFPGGGERTVCNTNADCGGATCVRCKPFGGDGCAANCTRESTVVFTLAPGELNGTDLKIATSGSVIHGDALTILQPFPGGTQTFLIGKVRNSRIPVAQKPSLMQLPRLPVSTFGCACVRGAVFKTCGGATKEADGVTDSTDCTADASVCAGKKPCVAVAGPGNSTEGTVACDMLQGLNYSIAQDAGAASGAAGPVIYNVQPGTGGPGSALIAAASRIGTVVGSCSGTTADYGVDGEFCTNDDPPAARGTASIQVFTTGTGCASISNANNLSSNDIGPFCRSGVPLSCGELASGITAGAALAGAFPLLNQVMIGDVVTTSVFVAQ